MMIPDEVFQYLYIVKIILALLMLLVSYGTYAQIAEKYYDIIDFTGELELFKDYSYQAYVGGCMETDYYGYYKMSGDTIVFTCAHYLEERPDYKADSKTQQLSCGHRTIVYPPDAFIDYEGFLPNLIKDKYIYKQDSIQLVNNEWLYHMYTKKYLPEQPE